MIYLRPLIDGELREMKILQETTKKKIFLSAFMGTFLHVTIDSFHHPTMKPFMPLDFNPLLGLFSTTELRTALFFCLMLSFPVYVGHVRGWVDLSE